MRATRRLRPVLVLLPPSETKAPGGDGSPLRLDTLSHPELTPTRRRSAGGGSALFGLLAADDPVPAYRLSASSSLPGVVQVAVERTGEHALDLIVRV